MPDRIKRQKFIFLSLLLLVVFLFPLVRVANKPVRVAGIPALYLYFFITWLISILLLYRTAESRSNPPRHPNE